MGLLVGLPLKLFHMLFVLLRLAWPVLLILLVLYLIRRRQRAAGRSWSKSKAPDFDGPVVEVDYTVVEEDEKTEGED